MEDCLERLLKENQVTSDRTPNNYIYAKEWVNESSIDRDDWNEWKNPPATSEVYGLWGASRQTATSKSHVQKGRCDYTAVRVRGLHRWISRDSPHSASPQVKALDLNVS